ncbi:MAG: IS200/IS605 family transposase [Anaerolineae bacterium]|nr:IS200/IS605 family transposase [Anaerolineae bacterium]
MPFWKCFYHAVWATANREPIITSAVETIIIATIQHKSHDLNCRIWAINSIADHIHIAVSIPPKLSPAEWIRNVKGLSTHEVNGTFPDLPSAFKWQTAYGLLTFGEKALPFVTAYIQNQKQHHAEGRIQPYLEQTDEP